MNFLSAPVQPEARLLGGCAPAIGRQLIARTHNAPRNASTALLPSTTRHATATGDAGTLYLPMKCENSA